VRLSILRGNLSITHDIDTITPEEQTRQRLTREIATLSTVARSTDTSNKIKLIRLDNPASPELLRIWEPKPGEKIPEFTAYSLAREAFSKAKTSTEKLKAIGALEKANTGMDMARRKGMTVDW
jgi:hypothetical protein